MASIQPRTILEYIAMLGVIYLVVGGQFTGVLQSLDTQQHEETLPLSREKIESLVYPDPQLKCDDHLFNVHVFSRSPLIFYIPSFISEAESQHLIDIRYAVVFLLGNCLGR